LGWPEDGVLLGEGAVGRVFDRRDGPSHRRLGTFDGHYRGYNGGVELALPATFPNQSAADDGDRQAARQLEKSAWVATVQSRGPCGCNGKAECHVYATAHVAVKWAWGVFHLFSFVTASLGALMVHGFAAALAWYLSQ